MTSEFSIAAHAIVYLNHKQQTLSSEQLSENICTNPARIRKVMAKLRQAGLIVTKEGADGGYRFVLDPAQVTLLQIFSAVGERAAQIAWHSGDADLPCLVASGMAGIMDDVCLRMDAACKRELAAITVSDIDKKIFGAAASKRISIPIKNND